jgi:phosphonate transport system substrate-binding protein
MEAMAHNFAGSSRAAGCAGEGRAPGRRRAARLLVVLLAVAAAAAPVAAAAGSPERALRLGVIPFYTAEKIHQLYEPLVLHLSRVTGRAWTLKAGISHHAIVGELCAGEIDVAYLGPLPFARAVETCGARPLVISLDESGAPRQRAHLVTADPAIGTVGALRGRRFALFRGSTISDVLARSMLADAGIDERDVIPVWVPAMDRVVAAVLSNEAAAGVVKESLAARFATDGLRTLAVSAPLPHFVFAAAPRLEPAAADSLAASLLALHPRESAADREIVAAWDPELQWGFASPPPELEAQMRTVWKALEGFRR